MTCSSNTTCNPDPNRLAGRQGRGRRLALVLAAFVVPFALAPVPGAGQGSDAEAQLARARNALQRGDGIDAEMSLRAALERGAPRDRVAALMGEAYLDQGDSHKARDWLRGGAFSADTAAAGWRAMARLERLEGNLPAAGKAYDRVLAITPDDPSIWVEIGQLRYAGGEHLLAIDAADHALSLDPGNARALQFRGRLVRDRFGLLASLPWFERAIMQAPRDVSVLLDYAATLGELGRASEALTITRRVLELDEGNPTAYYLQAVIAARAGKGELARRLLERTEGKLDGQPGVMMLSGALFLASQNPSAAAEAFEAVLRAKPDSRRARDLLARAIYMSGEYRYLTIRFAADIASDEASPYLLTTVARGYEVLGDRLKAGELLDRAARPDRAPLRVVGSTTRIGQLLAEGQAERAEAAAESARLADPGFYDNMALAGDVQLALGHAEAAQARYARAAEIRMPESLFQRRYAAYLMAGDMQGAAQLVEGYLVQNPTSRIAMRTAASLAIATGSGERARAILNWLRRTGDERDVELLSNLAMVDARVGDPEGALDAAREAYRLQRSSPLATQALGFGYAAFDSRPGLADALFDKAQKLVGNSALIAEGRAMLSARRKG